MESPHFGEPAAERWPPARLPSARKYRDRVWLHVLLLLATIGSTTLVGGLHYASFVSDLGREAIRITGWELLVRGLWYSGTVLAILGAHELGHYFACRYYRVDASLPYFIPAPPILLFGTFGAFIRIREPIPSKRMLFDIGIAGPIAGFLIAIPALFFGVRVSRMTPLPAELSGMLSLGEPLLLKFASWIVWGATPETHSLSLHPVAFAAWFGLLATALNLFPIGQLDGGHISYAVLGRRSTNVTIATVGIAVLLTYFSYSWIVWTALMVVMLFAFGPRHPRTLDEEVPLDAARRWLAFAALVIFVICFTPTPIEPADLLKAP